MSLKPIETNRSREALRRTLRAGDPAGDGREPGPEEFRRLQARVLEEARQAPGRAPRSASRPAAGVAWACAALVCVALLVAAGTMSLWRDAPRGAEEATGGAEAGEAAARQVQFTTPGGTRIVWVLYPETP